MLDLPNLGRPLYRVLVPKLYHHYFSVSEIQLNNTHFDLLKLQLVDFEWRQDPVD